MGSVCITHFDSEQATPEYEYIVKGSSFQYLIPPQMPKHLNLSLWKKSANVTKAHYQAFNGNPDR